MQDRGGERRKPDGKVDELYDALIGTPRNPGFLEYARAEFKSIQLWQKEHTEEHEARDAGAAEVRRTWKHLALGVAEKALLTAMGLFVGWLAAQVLGTNGGGFP